MVPNKEALLRKQLAGTLKDVEISELEVRGALYVTGCSALVLMEHTLSSIIYTVHCIEIREVTNLGLQELVMRRREITRALEPSLVVPHVVKTFKTDSLVAELLMTNGLCSVEALLEQGPFDEALAAFVGASVVVRILQQTYCCHCVCRCIVYGIVCIEHIDRADIGAPRCDEPIRGNKKC